MFIIGIDPHKGSHTAAVIDRDEQLVGVTLRCVLIVDNATGCCAGRRHLSRGCGRLKARPGTARCWRSSSSSSGETVVDVPAALSARARLLDSGRKDKTDAHDARSAAIVALRHRNLRAVALEDHRQILRLLARRHHQLTAARTRAICRLHAVFAEMIEGGLSKNLSAKRASAELRKVRPTNAIGIERKRIAVEFLDEVRRTDRALGRAPRTDRRRPSRPRKLR